jgi:DDE domain
MKPCVNMCVDPPPSQVLSSTAADRAAITPRVGQILAYPLGEYDGAFKTKDWSKIPILRADTHWRWHLDEVYVKINGEMRYLWRAVDHEGEVLESLVTKERDKAAALKFMRKLMAPRRSAEDHHRRAALLQGGDEGAGKRRQASGRALRQQPGGKQPPALPTTRAGHAPIPEDEDTPEIRLGTRLSPQSLQPGTPPHRPRNLQGETLGGPLRVAGSHGLSFRRWSHPADRCLPSPHSIEAWDWRTAPEASPGFPSG